MPPRHRGPTWAEGEVMVTKAHVLSEIVRTAKANGGMPLGRDRFFAETGIKEADWLGSTGHDGVTQYARLD